jgi:hypothetical protein
VIIGAMIAAAPASISRLASAKSPSGIRARVGLPASATARIACVAPIKSTPPCCK